MGDALSPKTGRFDWWTSFPPLNWVRTQNGPPSTFTNETDERRDPNPGRPYVELWAGVSDQFFHRADFPALEPPQVQDRHGTIIHRNKPLLPESSKSTRDYVSYGADVAGNLVIRKTQAK